MWRENEGFRDAYAYVFVWTDSVTTTEDIVGTKSTSYEAWLESPVCARHCKDCGGERKTAKFAPDAEPYCIGRWLAVALAG